MKPCTNCREYGHNKFWYPKPPFERKTAGREGPKAARAIFGLRVRPGTTGSQPHLLCDNLTEMKRMGDHDGDVFMEDESANI